MIRKILPAFAVALVSFGVLFTGCEEDVVEPGTDAMKATVDGEQKEATDVVVAGSSTVSITGAFGDGSSVTVVIPETVQEGTFDLPATNGASVAYAETSAGYSGLDGTLEITSKDADNVSGTFEFTGVNIQASDTVQVTNGSFSANLQ